MLGCTVTMKITGGLEQRRAGTRAHDVLVCAIVASSALGCGAEAPDAPMPDEPIAGARAPAAQVASGCVVAEAGAGFVSLALTGSTSFDTLDVTVTPSAPGLDGVVGFAAGPVTRFSELQGAVRFSDANVIEAYDGAGYRADDAVGYAAGTAYPLRVIADVPSKRYSVFKGPWQDATALAQRYAFRPTARATQIAVLTAIVDGPRGSLTVCGGDTPPAHGAYSREGDGYAVLPLANDQALITDGAATQHVSATGQVLATIDRGGALGGDVDHFAIAALRGGDVVVDVYDHFALAHSSATPIVAGSAAIEQVVVDARNAVKVVATGGGTGAIYAFDGSGVAQATITHPADHLQLDGAQAVAVQGTSSHVTVSSYNPDGTRAWQRVFAGSAAPQALIIDGAHGVVFAGVLQTPISFGGATLPVPPTPETGPRNAYLAKLAGADGAHVFSQRTETTSIGGLAATANHLVLSTTLRTQFHYHQLQELDYAGHAVATVASSLGIGENGQARGIAVSPTGRGYWAVDMMWPYFPAWPYLFAIASL